MTVTTTTVPTVIDAFLAAVNADTETPQAFESWPGPEAAPEMFVLGEIDWATYEIPTIKAGRKARQETYDIGFELFVMGAEGTSPAEPSAARLVAFNFLAPIEDLLAEDPSGGTDYVTVQHVQLRPTAAGPRKFERGWAYRIAGQIHVEARLL